MFIIRNPMFEKNTLRYCLPGGSRIFMVNSY